MTPFEKTGRFSERGIFGIRAQGRGNQAVRWRLLSAIRLTRVAPWLGGASAFVRVPPGAKDCASPIGCRARRVTTRANSIRPRTQNFASNADRWNFTVRSDRFSEPAISLL